MQIRNLCVRNFRGIRSLEWNVPGKLLCLVGPGNATKSTILDAIEYVLSPRWSLDFEDCDFYQSNVDSPIEIDATVGQVPDRLLSEEKYGLYARGWCPPEGIHDEPQEDDELVLTICLRVGRSLEPEWTVVNDRDPEGRRISSVDRQLLGVTRLGTYVDRHLSWARGSALCQLTDAVSDASYTLTEANRKAREGARASMLSEFEDTAQRAQRQASELGVYPRCDYVPALDSKAVGMGAGAIAIHEGAVPLRLAGLGDRRLTALGLQLLCVEQGAILLADEVEHALEPHRIRHLLRRFQELAESDDQAIGQIILTSHNHTVVVELPSECICVVRSQDGSTSVRAVGTQLQGITRSAPEALLGRNVIVCEGKTEYGLCRGLERYWIDTLAKLPLAYHGTTLIEGGGDAAPGRALDLAKLGYTVCLFIDSDKLDTLDPSVDALRKSGVEVIHWDDRVAIEERIALDVPWEVLMEVLALAMADGGQESRLDAVCALLNAKRTDLGEDFGLWLHNERPRDQVRTAIGKAAKTRGWFKRIDHGEELGRVIAPILADIPGTDLARKIVQLSQWVYGYDS